MIALLTIGDRIFEIANYVILSIKKKNHQISVPMKKGYDMYVEE